MIFLMKMFSNIFSSGNNNKTLSNAENLQSQPAMTNTVPVTTELNPYPQSYLSTNNNYGAKGETPMDKLTYQNLATSQYLLENSHFMYPSGRNMNILFICL